MERGASDTPGENSLGVEESGNGEDDSDNGG